MRARRRAHRRLASRALDNVARRHVRAVPNEDSQSLDRALVVALLLGDADADEGRAPEEVTSSLASDFASTFLLVEVMVKVASFAALGHVADARGEKLGTLG